MGSVLITGGSDGIGLGLARRFHARGHRVLVTGRDPDKLAAAAATGLLVYQSDIGVPGQREDLAAHVRGQLPDLAWLVNNAGIQRRVGLAEDQAPWADRQRELDILVAGPVHLTHLLVPHLLAQPGPTTIVNVTSGGAYVPQVFAPLYSACKAALRSYTATLRDALARTACRVVELVPPAVQTALAPNGVPHGVPLDAFCDAAFAELAETTASVIGYGATAGIAERHDLADVFAESARRASVRRY